MAGERKGKTYEALVKLSLKELARRGDIPDHIHWNVTPSGMTIEPDFTVGADPNCPSHLFLVTHSGSTKNSDMKFWRNLGELAEAKVRLSTVPKVISVVFDAEVKEALKLTQGAAFDGQVVVGDTTYGPALEAWVDASSEKLPADMNKKADALSVLIGVAGPASVVGRAFAQLVVDLGAQLRRDDPPLDRLWMSARARVGSPVREAKNTSARRGLSKALLLGRMPTRASHVQTQVPDWVAALGFMTPSISGPRDADLAWLATSSLSNLNVEQLLASTSEGFRSQLVKVRSVGLITQYVDFVCQNLNSLQTESGMQAALQAQHRDPSSGLSVPPGVEAPRNVWLFDIVGAVLKAKSGKAQAFGYSTFAREAGESHVGNMPLGTWCSCFMNQWFNRKPGFVAPAGAVRHCALVLSDALLPVTALEVSALRAEIRSKFLAKEFEATLLSHRGFDPIGELVRQAVSSRPYTEERIAGAFSEKAGVSSGAGATGVLRVQDTIIKWQSVTDQGRDHKKKELCGRAPSLRYTWNKSLKQFERRPGVRKLILVIDGTWRKVDIQALVAAGWDEVLYPDEMDDLIKAIV